MDELQLYGKMKNIVVIVCSTLLKKKEEGEEGMKGEGEEGKEEEEEENKYSRVLLGAGVVIHKAGYVLTCAHLVPKGFKVLVSRPGEDDFWVAEVFLRRKALDLAVVRIKKLRNGPFKFCRFGDGKSVHMGMRLYSISHPTGAHYSFLLGEVAFLQRGVAEIPIYCYTAPFSAESVFIQINNLHCLPFGSFGAPVFGSDGKVYGLTAFNHTYDFAIPSTPLLKMVTLFRKKLLKKKRKRRLEIRLKLQKKRIGMRFKFY